MSYSANSLRHDLVDAGLAKRSTREATLYVSRVHGLNVGRGTQPYTLPSAVTLEAILLAAALDGTVPTEEELATTRRSIARHGAIAAIAALPEVELRNSDIFVDRAGAVLRVFTAADDLEVEIGFERYPAGAIPAGRYTALNGGVIAGAIYPNT